MPDDLTAADSLPPRAIDVLPVVGIAPVLAGLAAWAGTSRLGPLTAAALGAAGAITLGVPPFFWALDHGRARPAVLAAFGAVAGAGVPCVLLAGGVAGQLARHGGDYVKWVVGHGAPLPAYGLLPWPAFAVFAGAAAVVGAVSGALHAALLRALPRR